MRSLEQYEPDKIEAFTETDRFVIFIEDNHPVVEKWIETFGPMPGVYYIVPHIHLGFTEALERFPFTSVPLVIADRFLLDDPRIPEEVNGFLDRVKSDNPDSLIIETCMIDPHGKRRYTSSHAAIWGQYGTVQTIGDRLEEQQDATLAEKIFTLEKVLFPAFAHAQLLEASRENLSAEDLQHHFETLKNHILYWTLFDHIPCDPDEFEDAFARLPNPQKITLLHCAFSCLGHLDRDHGESFYSMLGMRIGYLVRIAQAFRNDGSAGQIVSID